MEVAQPLWATSSGAWLSLWWRFFYFYPVWISLVSTYSLCLPSSHYVPLWRAWLCHLDNLVIGTCNLLLDLPEAFSSSLWTSSSSQSCFLSCFPPVKTIISQLGYKNAGVDSVQNLAEVEYDIHCSLLIYRSSCFIIDSNQKAIYPLEGKWYTKLKRNVWQ